MSCGDLLLFGFSKFSERCNFFGMLLDHQKRFCISFLTLFLPSGQIPHFSRSHDAKNPMRKWKIIFILIDEPFHTHYFVYIKIHCLLPFIQDFITFLSTYFRNAHDADDIFKVVRIFIFVILDQLMMSASYLLFRQINLSKLI